MIVDANLLLYAVDTRSVFHGPAARWLTTVLNGDERVGLPWQTVGAFVRIITHPRVTSRPLTTDEAHQHVDAWMAASPTWVPPTTERTVAAFSSLSRAHHVTGNLVPDAQLAAMALEHGVAVASADSDFARFPEVRWVNPVS